MLIKNLNNKKYRNSKHVLQHIKKTQDFSSSTILSPSSAFYKPIVISKYSTGSDSIVFKLVLRKSKRIMILKMSPKIESSLHEIQLYNVINKIVEKNISPHLIKYYKLQK